MRVWIMAVCLALCAAAHAQPMPPMTCNAVHSPELDALASKPYRPAWMPIPVMRTRVAFVPFLERELRSSDAETRAQAAFLLGQIGYRPSAKHLARGLRDPERSVRVQCGIALAWLGDARGIPSCAAVLKSDLPSVRYYAVCGLWQIGGARAKAILGESLPGQAKLVMTAIKGALTTKRVPPPDLRLPRSIPDLTWDDVLQAACDDYIAEGDWWWHQGDFEQGIRTMEAVVFLDPSDVESFGVIAWLHRSLKREAESDNTLKRCVAANPKSPEAHFELGFHYMTAEKYALAEPYLRRSVELGGDHLCMRQYANCLEKLGRPKEALDHWSKILQMRPEDPAAKFNVERLTKLLNPTNLDSEKP